MTWRGGPLAFLALLLGVNRALAKEPCDPEPKEDLRACEELGRHVLLPLVDSSDPVGMDDTAVYAFQPDGTAEKKIRLLHFPLAGGPPTVLANEVGWNEPGSGSPLIVGATDLYWTTREDVLVTVPRSGGEIVPLLPPTDPDAEEKSYHLVSSGDRIWWVHRLQGNDAELWERSLPAGKPRRLLRRKDAFDHLTAAGETLVWLEQAGASERVFFFNARTHALRSVLRPSPDDEVFADAADARFFYLGMWHSTRRIPVNGGRWEIIRKGSVESLAVGEQRLFFNPWWGNCGGGHPMAMSSGGGPVRELSKCGRTYNWMARGHRLYFLGPGGLGAFDD